MKEKLIAYAYTKMPDGKANVVFGHRIDTCTTVKGVLAHAVKWAEDIKPVRNHPLKEVEFDNGDLYEYDEKTKGFSLVVMCHGKRMTHKMVDVDGTNLVEMLVCSKCGNKQ